MNIIFDFLISEFTEMTRLPVNPQTKTAKYLRIEEINETFNVSLRLDGNDIEIQRAGNMQQTLALLNALILGYWLAGINSKKFPEICQN